MQIPEDLIRFVQVKTNQYGDFTVKTWTIKGRNEDEIYSKNPALIDLIPRGCSDLFYKDQLVAELRGPKKFFGTTEYDEDEADSSQSSFPSTDLTKPKQWESEDNLLVHFHEKANGKFAIFKMFELNQTRYIFGGSKNVHIPYKFDDHGLTAEHTQLHEKIMLACIVQISRLMKPSQESLLNRNILGEYVDGHHIVWAMRPYMVFFNEDILPSTGSVLLSRSGMPIKEQLDYIRDLENIEGVVIMYQNTQTKEVIRQKHKTKWYVLWRCFREFISRRKPDTTEEEIHKTHVELMKKIQQRSNTFLHLSNEELAKYSEEFLKFLKWFNSKNYKYQDLAFNKQGIAWFINEFHRVPLEQKEEPTLNPEDFLADRRIHRIIIQAALFNLRVNVILSGPSGSGKSTYAKMLAQQLAKNHITCSIHNTDSYFLVDGKYQFDPKKLGAHHKANQDAFAASQAQVRISDNTNLKPFESMPYREPSGNPLILLVCMKKHATDVLCRQSTHSVPPAKLEQMNSTYKIRNPVYFGLFPNPEEIRKLADQLKLPVSQKTPFHITCDFSNNGKTLDEASHSHLLGADQPIEITGYSQNVAGVCLIARHISDQKLNGNHITLHTNEKFTPVQVGANIDDSNIIQCDPVVIPAIYSPMY